MIGNFEEMTNPKAIGASTTSLPSQILNLPLPFSHFRESGIALPTAALPYNQMTLNFNFRNWNSLLIIDNYNLGVSIPWPSSNATGLNSGSQPNLVADVWAEYALVSNMERVQMGKAPRDMLIEQVQTGQSVMVQPSSGNSAATMVSLYFAHSVKALFFGVQNTTNSSEWANYTSASPVPTNNGVIFSPSLATDPINSTSLYYENTQRLSNMGSDYYSLIQPWYTAVSIPLETGYHLYSYSLDLINTNPMGSTNYGKLTNVQLAFNSSADSIMAYNSGGSIGNINTALAQYGAGLAQTYSSVVLALNHNIVRIAGGALGQQKGGQEQVGAKLCGYIIYIFGKTLKPPSHLYDGETSYNVEDTLRASTTTCDLETFHNTREWNLGMVKMLKIGQFAGKESKAVKQGYDSPSTTERMLVNYNGLANLVSLRYSLACGESHGVKIVPSLVNRLIQEDKLYHFNTFLY
jgi:hypothetical protein